MPPTPRITISKAAELIGRNPETVRRWVRSGRMPAERVAGQLYIKVQDWESHFTKRRVG